jgi:formate-dependent nitrite reductase membrane component NrfD
MINNTQKSGFDGDIIANSSVSQEFTMSKKPVPVLKKKLNVPGLISFVLFFLVFPLLLIPWQRLFVLRSNTISVLVISIIGLFVIGILMLGFAIFALVLSRKRKGQLKGTWLAIVGLVLGIISAGYSGFIIVDYFIHGRP